MLSFFLSDVNIIEIRSESTGNNNKNISKLWGIFSKRIIEFTILNEIRRNNVEVTGGIQSSISLMFSVYGWLSNQRPISIERIGYTVVQKTYQRLLEICDNIGNDWECFYNCVNNCKHVTWLEYMNKVVEIRGKDLIFKAVEELKTGKVLYKNNIIKQITSIYYVG